MADIDVSVGAKDEASTALEQVRDQINVLAQDATRASAQAATANEKFTQSFDVIANSSASIDTATNALNQVKANLSALATEATRSADTVASSSSRSSASVQRFAADTQKASQQIQASNQQTGFSFGSLGKVVAGVVSAYAGFLSVRGLISFASDATAAFNKQTEAAEGLRAALEGLVPDARAAADAHAEYAAELQKITAVGDEETLALMRRASLLGVAEDQLDMVAAATIGLSEATGVGMNEALRKVNETINGNTSAFADYLPALKETKDQEQQLALVTELAEKGLRQKEESLGRLDGAQARAAGALGDFSEAVGALLAPFRILVSNGLAVFAETATAVLAPAVDVANQSIEQLGEWMQWSASIAIGAVTAIEVGYNNMSNIVAMAIDTTALAIVQFSENVKHHFTEVIPAYLGWFGGNWLNILADIASATLTVFRNLGSNIGETVMAIIDWAMNGFQDGFDGLSERMSQTIQRGMLDGFKASTQPLPEIAAREITAEERMLAERVGKMGLAVGKEFNDKYKQRMEEFRSFTAESQSIDLDLKASEGLNEGLKANADALQAVEGRLLSRGEADDPNSKIADNTKQTVDELRRVNSQLASQPPQPPVEITVNGT